ncbi:MAG: hypothetical protein OQL09_00730 [Gammaproteobacteria bacterium]|nr:hypothetical protein [Gammaproteobacteria bacterium]
MHQASNATCGSDQGRSELLQTRVTSLAVIPVCGNRKLPKPLFFL